MNETILIVEDDMEISELLSETLFNEGYHIKLANCSVSALKEIDYQIPDLVIIDCNLPDVTDSPFFTKIHKLADLSILLLLDSSIPYNPIIETYPSLMKPFSKNEVIYQVAQSLNRFYKQKEVIKIGELQIHLEQQTIEKNDEILSLTTKEFQLFILFIQFPERIFTKKEIYQEVWGEEYFGDENVINVHIHRLREKIETVPSKPKYIKTLWGIGYKLGDMK